MSSTIGDSKGVRQYLTFKLCFNVFTICIGALQFGYHIAMLNAPAQFISCENMALGKCKHLSYKDTIFGEHFKQCIPMNTEQVSQITSIFSIGGLVGSIMTNTLSNKFGRKKCSIFANSISLIASWAMFGSFTFQDLMLSRFFVGVACGIFLVNGPLYINEISPVQLRGLMGSMGQVFINLGVLLTQSIALRYANAYEWRWIMVAAWIISICNMVFLFIITESPKWLVIKMHISRAEAVLRSLRPEGTDSKLELQEIQRNLNSEEVASSYDSLDANRNDNSHFESSNPSLLSYTFKRVYSKPRLVITMILMGQQFCGINAIIFYGVRVIKDLSPELAMPINFSVSVVNVIMTVVASVVIDKKGRKPLLLTSVSVLSVASLFISFSIVKSIVTLLVIALLVYIAAFALGLGPIPFLIISEFSKSSDSSAAQSYGIVCNWLATFLVAYFFPLFHDLLGGYVFAIFAAFGALFSLFIIRKVPETKGKVSYTEVWSNY